MNTGDRIKHIREDKKISLVQLAQKAFIDTPHLEKIEKGEIAPAPGTLIKLSRIPGVRLGTFLDDVTDKGLVIAKAGQPGPTLNITATGSGTRDNLSFLSLAREKSNRHRELGSSLIKS